MAKDLVLNIIMKAGDKASGAFARLGRASRSLSGVLQDNQKELRRLERAQKDVAAYAGLRNKLRETSASLAAVRDRQKQLTDEMRKAGGATRAQQNEMARLGRKAEELNQKQTRQRRELQQLNTKLQESGVHTRNLGRAQAELAARHAAASAAAERQKTALNRLAKAQNDVERAKSRAGAIAAHGAGAGAAAYAIGRGMMRPVQAYASAESAGMDLRVAMMDSGGRVAAEYAEIDALATRLGDRLPGTTADFKNLMTMLVRQGMSAQTILGGTGEAAAYLAVQLRKSPEAAAEMAAKLQDAVRASESEMLGLVDTVQRLYYAGVEDGNILGAFSKLSPALDITRVKGEAALQMFSPLIGMLDQAGLSGESAGNALRKVFSLAMDTARVNKAMRDAGLSHLGIDFTNGKGEFGGIEQMYQQLAKLQQLNTEQRLALLKKIFGDDAETLQALNTMIAKGQAGYDEFAARIEAQASLQQRIDATLGTLTNLWDSATGSATNLMVALGESIQGEVKAAVEWIDDVSTRLGNWARENPQTANSILKVVAAVGIGLAVFAALAAVLSAVLVPMAVLKFSWVTLFTSAAGGVGKISLLTQAFTMLRGALGGLMAFMAANPIIGGIMLVVGALYLLYSHWEKIDTAFADNPILNTIFPVIGLARALINNWELIGPFFVGLWSSLKTLFADNPALYAIPFVGWVMWIINNWEKLGPWFSGLWEKIKAFFGGGIADIGAKILNWSPLNLFYQAFAAVLSWFDIELPSTLSAAGSKLIQSIIDGISAKLPGLMGAWRSVTAIFDGIGNRARAAPGALGKTVGASVRGYSSGGYTGAGGIHDAAGIVHRGEVVFSQRDVARWGGWRVVDALRSGGARALQALRLSGMGGGSLIGRAADALAGWLSGSGEAAARRPAAGSLASPAGFGAAAVQVAGAPITINIYADPGQSERSIADAVARELAKQQQQQQRRANSAYRDKD